MTSVLAIDPGSERSAWMGLDDEHPVTFGKVPNAELLGMLRARDLVRRLSGTTGTTVIVEFMSPRHGKPTSVQEFETLWWAGQFAEAARPARVGRLRRDRVKYLLCGRQVGVTDAHVRAALIDRYGGVGGKERAIGRKAAPGPLYGVSADVWAALAVALMYRDHPEEATP